METLASLDASGRNDICEQSLPQKNVKEELCGYVYTPEN